MRAPHETKPAAHRLIDMLFDEIRVLQKLVDPSANRSHAVASLAGTIAMLAKQESEGVAVSG